MLQTQTVSEELLGLLKNLMTFEDFEGLRLVGGTSLALQMGHRNSIDIDLFGLLNLDDLAIKKLLTAHFLDVKIFNSSKSIKIFLINGVKVDIVKYPYAWLKPAIEVDGFRLASKEDIAAMKIAAITQRGSRKDFIDLYFLLEHFTIHEIFEFYESKITDGNLWLALRSLSYFDDAEKEPMPKMFINRTWEEMKSLITEVVARFQNTL